MRRRAWPQTSTVLSFLRHTSSRHPAAGAFFFTGGSTDAGDLLLLPQRRAPDLREAPEDAPGDEHPGPDLQHAASGHRRPDQADEAVEDLIGDTGAEVRIDRERAARGQAKSSGRGGGTSSTAAACGRHPLDGGVDVPAAWPEKLDILAASSCPRRGVLGISPASGRAEARHGQREGDARTGASRGRGKKWGSSQEKGRGRAGRWEGEEGRGGARPSFRVWRLERREDKLDLNLREKEKFHRA